MLINLTTKRNEEVDSLNLVGTLFILTVKEGNIFYAGPNIKQTEI